MGISNKRGSMRIPKEMYDSTECDAALSKLEVKVYSINYEPLMDSYKIYFTSPYVDEAQECCDLPEYSIEISPRGFRFVD